MVLEGTRWERKLGDEGLVAGRYDREEAKVVLLVGWSVVGGRREGEEREDVSECPRNSTNLASLPRLKSGHFDFRMFCPLHLSCRRATCSSGCA